MYHLRASMRVPLVWRRACPCDHRKAGHDVAQRSIEVFIGRLVTDEGFRDAFIDSSMTAIRAFIDAGHELTAVEVAALVATRPGFWERVADQIDPRLQKASLQSFSRKG
jgi:hypothetical protein